jgi:rod shape-determining protein MreD
MLVIQFVAMTYAVFTLQTSLPALVGGNAWLPHFVLAGLAWVAWRFSSNAGLVAAAFWGALADGLSPDPAGIEVVGFTTCAWLVQQTRARTVRCPMPGLALLAGALVLAETSCAAAARLALAQRTIVPRALLLQAAGPAVATALLVALVASVYRLLRPARAAIETTDPPRVSNRWQMLTE